MATAEPCAATDVGGSVAVQALAMRCFVKLYRIQSIGASSSRLPASTSWDPFSTAGCLDPMYSNEALLHQPSEFSVDLLEISSEDELPHMEVDKLSDNSYMLSTDLSAVAPASFVSADRAAANKPARMTAHRLHQYVKEFCQLDSVSLPLSDEFITLLKRSLSVKSLTGSQSVGQNHRRRPRFAMATTSSFLHASRSANSTLRPRTAPAAAACMPLPSRSSCPPLRASAFQTRVAAPAMRPPVVSTVVDVDFGDRSYPIYIGSGLLDEPELLQRHVAGKRVLVVTNTTVAPLYLEKLTWALKHGNPNISVESVVLPDGEKCKDMDTLMKVFDKAVESRMDRRCTFVALGGGVIGDMCGFAAASFLRGVDFIQIPTTLMAQVDSSIGGKTGINHPLGKNMIGAFYQATVCVDRHRDTGYTASQGAGFRHR